MNWPGWAELFLYGNYALYGPLAWAGYGWAMFNGRRKMLLLEKPRPAPDPAPHVTILVPAKDEGERIRACINSILAQNYSSFDLISIDDRSVDNTGKVMDEIAATAGDKMRVIHIQEGTLAPGWTGKNNALFTGAKAAQGEWLLFVDSDVILQPDALSRTLSMTLFKKFDMTSLLPKLETYGIWESSLIPLCAGAASTMYLIALNNNAQMKSVAFANGQFLLISRMAYDKIGGHETVKDRYCEDVEIARQMKLKDLRPRVSWGNEVAAVRMYSSFRQIIKGWSRIYYAARVGNPMRTLAGIQFLVMCCFTAYAALIYGVIRALHPNGNFLDSVWLITGILHWILMTVFLSYIYAWSGNKRLNALFFPVAGPVLLYIMCKSVWMCVTKKVEWRGTSYQHAMAADLEKTP